MSLPVFPATDFDAVIEAYGKGVVKYAPLLAYFDFRDAPMALWGGEYTVTWGGVTWLGAGKSGALVSVEGLDDNSASQAGDITIKLSGVDSDIMTIFKDEDRGDYVGRLVGLYWQFCDETWQPISGASPMSLRAGIMGTLTADRVQNEKGAWLRTITLPASNIFYGRSNAKASYYTDRDQKLRYPGDRFLEYVQSIQEFALRVPWK